MIPLFNGKYMTTWEKQKKVEERMQVILGNMENYRV